MIREYMGEVDGDEPLGGPFKRVEVDEAYFGGTVEGRGPGYVGNKAVVIGMYERGGNVMTKVVADRRGSSLLPVIRTNVLPHSEVHTDELRSYEALFDHGLLAQVGEPSGQGICQR